MAAWPDWTSLFGEDSALLPAADDPDFLWAQPTTVRACFVRLDDLLPAVPARKAPTAPLAVHADVLRIDGAVSLAVRRLTLHARRIELGRQASIALQPADADDPSASLRLCADEWVFAGAGGALEVTVGGVWHRFTPGAPGAGLAAAVARDGSVELRETAGPDTGDPLAGQIMLGAAKRLAQLQGRDGDSALALRIADWVARTGGDTLLRQEARALAAQLRSAAGRRPFVPYLRLAAYRDLAEVTREALRAVEAERRNLFDRQLSLADHKRAAAHLLEHYRHAKRYAGQVLEQAAADMARAADAAAQAQKALADRGAEIEALQKGFEAGIAAKKAELERRAVFNVVTGLLAVGAGIAMVCLTGPAGTAVAAGGAAKVAEAGAKTAEQVNRLVELLKTIAKVLDAIKAIKGYYELLKSAFDAIHDPLEARRRAEAAGDRLPAPLDPTDTMGAAEWQEFMAALDGAFGPAQAQGIAGADELLLGMCRLAIRGQDLVATQAVLDRCQQRFQQSLWQTLRDEADIADMAARIEAINAERGPGMVLMSYHGQLRDRLRGRLLHGIERLSEAYRYEALDEPRFQPDPRGGGAELAKALSDAQQALVTARERRGAVSDWGPEGPGEVVAEALSGLRRGGPLSWVVGPDNFAGLDRIRVREIRVWIGGAPRAARFHVLIGTSGDYLDRLAGRAFEFASWPLQRSFRYERHPQGPERDPWGQPVRVTLRANDAEGDFFEPTAFSTWTIALPPAFNPGLDPSTITAVALEFVGTAMGAAPVRRGAVARVRATARPGQALIRRVITA